MGVVNCNDLCLQLQAMNLQHYQMSIHRMLVTCMAICNNWSLQLQVANFAALPNEHRNAG
jgi:predicted oxidoreductase (fatty acid repression mutant protein)